MTEIKREKNTVSFEMLVKAEEVAKAETEVYKKNKKYFQIPGFRKGHAPRKIIENMYGKDVFLEDAINDILPGLYDEKVKELGLEVVDQPNVDIEEAKSGQDIKVKISVLVKPEVKLGDYKGIEVEDVAYEVTEELIDSELENQRRMNARLVNVDDRPAKMGDKVNIDFKGFVDGEEFEGGAAQGQDLELGSNTFIPGFEEQIVGKELGAEFNVNVNFPEDYFSEDLKGKEAKFEVKLNKISYEELPDLDDDFIMDISDFDTIADYKAYVREEKEKEFSERAKREKEDKLIGKVVENMEVEIPNIMIEDQMDSQMKEFDRNLQAQGMKLQDYVNMIGSTFEAFRENMRDGAKNRVAASLALEAVAKAEEIKVEDSEIEAEVDKMVKEYFKDDQDQQKKMKDYILESNKEGFVENLVSQKTVDFLFENAKFVEKQVETKEEEQA